jgi:hypothetical protein
MNMNKTVTSVALVMSMAGISAPAQSAVLDFEWNGLFTMLSPNGGAVKNTSYPYYGDPTWGYGMRTQINGTMQFDTYTGHGTGSIVPFDFFDGGPPVFHDVNFQTIGDGFGGAGSLVIGQMLFDWKGNNNISVGIVLDASGVFAALQAGMMPGDTVTTADCALGGALAGSCAVPASNNIAFVYYGQLPIGAAPVVTTTYNSDGVSIIGNDVIGGSPMLDEPLSGYSINLDMTSVTLTQCWDCGVVPVPATVWLFGSGLLGLLAAGRFRKGRIYVDV